MKAKLAFLFAVLTLTLGMIACSDSDKKTAATAQPGVEDAVKTAVDAYVYGYPLVTMDMTRKQFTNVATVDAAHANMAVHVLTNAGSDASTDTAVTVVDGDVRIAGVVRGIDSDGALILETAAGVERILTGDVSIEGAYD